MFQSISQVKVKLWTHETEDGARSLDDAFEDDA